MSKIGRPSLYTPELAEEICERMVGGEDLVSIVEDSEHIPNLSTIFRWMEAFPSFREMYARARDLQQDVFAAQTIRISDRQEIGEKTEIRTEGEAEITRALVSRDVGSEVVLKSTEGRMAVTITEDMVGQQATLFLGVPSITTKVTQGDMTEHRKLRIMARQWHAAKVAHGRYGDRLAHQMLDEKGKPTKAGITVIVDGSPASL